jgi:glycolate oxidase iron-sulfur subunit
VAGLTRLVAMLAELEEQLVGCMRCGFCQSVCPLYAETGRETDVARGKLAMLDGLAHQLLADPEGVRQRLERCLLCGSCTAGCPSGVKTTDIFLQARAVLTAYLGLSPAKRVVFRQLLARPALFDRLMGWAPRLQGLIARPASAELGTSCARAQAWLGSRHFRRLAERPLHADIPSRRTAPGRAGLTAAVYVGCLTDKLFPGAGKALLEVLEHYGVGVSLPAGQACCGIPALAAGDGRGFRRLLAHNLALYDPARFDVLVTPCATCAATIRKMWPVMAQGLPPAQAERVRLIARRARDASELLVAQGLAPQPAGEGQGEAVTFHDPCHLKKSLGVAAEPRRLLAAAGWRLAEMAESDWCCGMGGSFNLAHYELSAAIGRRKLANLAATGARVVATGCPACLVQLSDGLSREGQKVRARHYLELCAQRL